MLRSEGVFPGQWLIIMITIIIIIIIILFL